MDDALLRAQTLLQKSTELDCHPEDAMERACSLTGDVTAPELLERAIAIEFAARDCHAPDLKGERHPEDLLRALHRERLDEVVDTKYLYMAVLANNVLIVTGFRVNNRRLQVALRLIADLYDVNAHLILTPCRGIQLEEGTLMCNAMLRAACESTPRIADEAGQSTAWLMGHMLATRFQASFLKHCIWGTPLEVDAAVEALRRDRALHAQILSHQRGSSLTRETWMEWQGPHI